MVILKLIDKKLILRVTAKVLIGISLIRMPITIVFFELVSTVSKFPKMKLLPNKRNEPKIISTLKHHVTK